MSYGRFEVLAAILEAILKITFDFPPPPLDFSMSFMMYNYTTKKSKNHSHFLGNRWERDTFCYIDLHVGTRIRPFGCHDWFTCYLITYWNFYRSYCSPWPRKQWCRHQNYSCTMYNKGVMAILMFWRPSWMPSWKLRFSRCGILGDF